MAPPAQAVRRALKPSPSLSSVSLWPVLGPLHLDFRQLKQLDAHISVSVVSPDMLDQVELKQDEGSTGDALFNLDYMHQLH